MYGAARKRKISPGRRNTMTAEADLAEHREELVDYTNDDLDAPLNRRRTRRGRNRNEIGEPAWGRGRRTLICFKVPDGGQDSLRRSMAFRVRNGNERIDPMFAFVNARCVATVHGRERPKRGGP